MVVKETKTLRLGDPEAVLDIPVPLVVVQVVKAMLAVLVAVQVGLMLLEVVEELGLQDLMQQVLALLVMVVTE